MKASEVKSYTAILIALEGAAESVRNLLREQADLSVAQQALATMRKPEHAAALQAMVRGAIAGAANALNFTPSTPTPPAARPLPDGWPDGWGLGQDLATGTMRYMSMRGDAATALRFDDPEDARRDAWERHWQETGT